MRRLHRNHAVAFKIKVAGAAHQGGETLAALAEMFDSSSEPDRAADDVVLENATNVFATATEKWVGAEPDLKAASRPWRLS